MDDVTTSAGQELSKRAGEFLSNVTPSSEIRELLGDRIRLWRWKRSEKMLERAQEFLARRGKDPAKVPTRVLFPILEHSEIEDDDQMTDRWASLLASAGANPESVPTAFTSILADLEPVEVQILDQIYEHICSVRDGGNPDWSELGITREHVLQVTGIDEERYEVIAGNLIRLQIVRGPGSKFGFVDMPERRFATLETDILSLTALGWAFIEACQPPG